MPRRPLSVDIAGAILYISGICFLLASVLYFVGVFFDPQRDYYKDFTIDVVQGAVELGIAIAILVVTTFIVKGANWARMLYVGMVVVFLAVQLLIGDRANWAGLIFSLLARVFIMVLLFLPGANLYFRPRTR